MLSEVDMNPRKITEENLRKALKTGLKGSDRACEYYPCHFEGQDCTWCFCPFYPCLNLLMKGEFRRYRDGTLIWGCKNCTWIHQPENAERIFDLLSDIDFGNATWTELSLILLKARYGKVTTLDFNLERQIHEDSGVKIFNLGERVLHAEGGEREEGDMVPLTPRVILVERGRIVGESISESGVEPRKNWLMLNPILYSYGEGDFIIVLPPVLEEKGYSAHILSESGSILRKMSTDILY